MTFLHQCHHCLQKVTFVVIYCYPESHQSKMAKHWLLKENNPILNFYGNSSLLAVIFSRYFKLKLTY